MNAKPVKKPDTLISFDLSKVLKPEEVQRFRQSAKDAGAKTITDHFLNLTLRLPHQQAA